jgi:transposase InsO family protein
MYKDEATPTQHGIKLSSHTHAQKHPFHTQSQQLNPMMNPSNNGSAHNDQSSSDQMSNAGSETAAFHFDVAHGILSSRPTEMEAEEIDKTAISRLQEKLDHTTSLHQQYLNDKTRLVLLYEDAAGHLPEEGREAAQIKLDEDFEKQVNPLQANLKRVEDRCKRLREIIEERTAALMERLHLEERAKNTTLDLEDANTARYVPLVENNRKHEAVGKVFKYKRIPVLEDSIEIDFKRIQIEQRTGAPTFQLKLEGVARQDIALKVVTGAVAFLEKFEKYYTNYLTEDLFDDLAWRYMSFALEPSEMSNLFDKTIVLSEYENRSWKQVQRCLAKIFQFDLMKSKLVSQLFSIVPSPNEDANSFVDRMEVLIKATGADERNYQLIAKIAEALPDAGREKIIAEFRSLDSVEGVSHLLRFIRSNPSVMMGRRSDPEAWFVSKFLHRNTNHDTAKATVTNVPAPQRPALQAMHGRGVQTFRGRGNQSFRGRGQLRSSPYQRNFQPADKNGTDLRCQDSTCRKFDRKHSDALCLRHSNPAKFAEINKKSVAREGRYGANAGKPRAHVAAMQQIQDDSLDDALGNDPYDNKAMDIDLYDEGPKPVASIDNPLSIAQAMRTSALNRDSTGKEKHQSPRYAASDTSRETGFRGAQKGDNRIAVAIIIEGVTYTALLDPGSNVSIIHDDVARDLRLKTALIKRNKIVLADDVATVQSVITMERISLVCNNRSVEWQLNVMRLGYYDFLIGMDLFPRLGYGIHGIVIPAEERSDVYVVDDDKPPIVPKEATELEQDKVFIEQKKQFLRAIEPLLQANGQIDQKSHCTLDVMRVELKVKDNCTIQERSRRFYAQTEVDEVNATVDKWLENGVIVEAPKGNPYNNSLTLAARRNLEGEVFKYRVCLDPRTLNKQLVDTDNFPIPIINEVLERAAGHKYFSTIDLSQAYHRLPLDKRSQPYTAFKHHNKQYMFARAPFGLKPMTSIFQRGMSQLLGDLHFVGVYVDDIVIFSNSIKEHAEHVKVVIDRLTRAKLIINKEKSNFLRTQVLLLGFVIDAKGRRINPEKIANVNSWAPPTNGKMIQRYLGMFNYFREYIPLYSTLAAPLDKLRNAKGSFTLSGLELHCFEQLKRLVTDAPVLSFPDFSQPFYVATDASNLGIGAVLYQLPNGPEDESKVNYISFMARALKTHERNYPAYKKELLGIIYACKKFHYYVWGRKFTLYTDHRPLTYIHDQKELPQILADWRETLLNYNFQCIYRPGLLNIIPDALSRAFPDELWQTKESPTPGKATNTVGSKVSAVITRRAFREAENAPMQLISTSEEMAENLDNTITNQPYVHVAQDKDTERQVPTVNKQKELLRDTHSFGHLGVNAMVTAIQKQGYAWPRMKEACTQWVQQCSQCQHFNIVRKGYHPLTPIHATLPGEHIAIDLAQFPISEQGNVYALVVVDVCTRFVFLEAIPTKEAGVIAARLFKLFCSIGFPKIIQSDNGTEFVNAVVKTLTAQLSIDHRLTTPYHPRANGVAERNVRSLKDILQKSLEGNIANWDNHLPMVQLQMNAKVASLHGSSPFSLFYGRSFAGISDFTAAQSHLMTDSELEQRLKYLTDLVFPAISEKSKATQQNMVKKFNSTHRITDFPVGSFVMVKDQLASGSLDTKYEGPFQVVNRTVRGTYVLRDATRQLLARNYAPEQLKKVTQTLDTENDEVGHYEVQAILGHKRIAGGKILYKVKWKGYDDEKDNSEITYDDFDSKAIVNQYYKRLNEQNPHLLAKKANKRQLVEDKSNRANKRQKNRK